MIARILILGGEIGELSYKVPSSLEVVIGQSVIVPIGTRLVSGVVTGFDETLNDFDYKEIVSITSSDPLFDEQGLQTSLLADAQSFIQAGTYLSIHLWKPPSPKVERKLVITGDTDNISPKELELLSTIKEYGEEATLGKINTRLGKKSITSALRSLVKKGVIQITDEISTLQSIKPRKHFEINHSIDQKILPPDSLNHLLTIAHEHKSFTSLSKASGLSLGKLKKLFTAGVLTLADDLLHGCAKDLEPVGFKEEYHDGLSPCERHDLYKAWANDLFAQGKSMAIICSNSFACKSVYDALKNSAKNVFLCTSDASQTENSVLWSALKTHAPSVAIGLESALLLPLQNLSKVCVDEPLSPHFELDIPFKIKLSHLAKIRAKTSSCTLALCGSGISLESFRQGNKPPQFHTKIDIVNMHYEFGASNQPLVSEGLVKSIKEEIEHGRPILILVGRKGYSNYIFCEDCSEALKCPKCLIPLTYHLNTHKVSCRFCGFSSKAPDLCPSCGGVAVRFKAGGTERLEYELSLRLPDCNIIRSDSDVKNSTFLARSFGKPGDVLITTSFYLDRVNLENVNLVCIASIDVILSMPIYSSTHRALSLVYLLSSRLSDGRVLLQTYMPTHPLIKAISSNNVEELIKTELVDREEAFYPPFSEILWWVVVGKEEKTSKEQAQWIAKQLSETISNIQVQGPGALYYHRLKGEYRWDILLKLRGLDSELADLREIYSHAKSRGIRLEVINPNV